LVLVLDGQNFKSNQIVTVLNNTGLNSLDTRTSHAWNHLSAHSSHKECMFSQFFQNTNPKSPNLLWVHDILRKKTHLQGKKI